MTTLKIKGADSAHGGLSRLPSITVALTAGGLLLVLGLYGNGYLGASISAISPLVYMICRSAFTCRSIFVPTASNIACIFYTVFFGAGLANIAYQGGDTVFTEGAVAPDLVYRSVASTALLTLAIAFGADLTDRSRVLADRPRQVRVVGVQEDRIFVFTALVQSAAILGGLLVVLQLGGFVAANKTFVAHDRNVGLGLSGSLGLTLWGIFNLPAVVSAMACSIAATNRIYRATSVLAGGLVMLLAIYVFASRLTIILALIACAGVLYHRFGRTVRPRIVGGVSVAFLAFSLVLLAQRSGEAIGSASNFLVRMLDSLSYGILDVTISVISHPSNVYDRFSSPDRYLTILSSISPFGGPSTVELSGARIDVIVVRAVGNAAQAASSGLPPSLPTSLFVGNSLLYGLMTGAAFGAAASLGLNALLCRQGFAYSVFTGLFVAFVFNVFKGGDLPLDLASEVRRAAYTLVLWIFVCLAFPPKRITKE